MRRQVERVSARDGYDLWAESYDAAPNPVVAMDARVTLPLLGPVAGERILDAGCGTGRYLRSLAAAGCRPVGFDFSLGMLAAAHAAGGEPLAAASLAAPLPVRGACFDAVLCALVGEHLDPLAPVIEEFCRVLRPGGRLAFSVYHPTMAAAGIEANFTHNGVEYRLGAHLHTTDCYLAAVLEAGFVEVGIHEFVGDEALAAAVPRARAYLGAPVLLVLTARRA